LNNNFVKLVAWWVATTFRTLEAIAIESCKMFLIIDDSFPGVGNTQFIFV
jgi:hypothetical protein